MDDGGRWEWVEGTLVDGEKVGYGMEGAFVYFDFMFEARA